MSLVKCPECGNEFSDKATACPECGFPTSELVQYQKESLIKEHTKHKTCYKCGSVEILFLYFEDHFFIHLEGN